MRGLGQLFVMSYESLCCSGQESRLLVIKPYLEWFSRMTGEETKQN